MFNFKKIKMGFLKYKEGVFAGGLVGLGAAIAYKLSGGTFSFALVDIQSRGAGIFATLSQNELSAIAYFLTLIAWVIIGAIIGFLIDMKFGLKFSKKTRNGLLVAALILFGYLLFADGNLGRAGIESRATATTALGALGKIGWPAATLVTIIIAQIFGFFKAIFAPEPTFPIWIFFVAGFAILLFLRRGGKQEQPIIIRQ